MRTPRESALALLGRRPYSAGEMRRALARKFPSDPNLEETIAELRAAGYLDDAKIAAQVAASLARNHAFGPARIRQELKRRLFDFRVIEPALESAFEAASERELLEKALHKKLRGMRLPLTPQKLRSLIQSLLRRGFRAGDIMKAVRRRAELEPIAESIDADNEQEEITNC